MNNSIDSKLQNPSKRIAWLITLSGLLSIVGLVSLPFIFGEPDGDKMPDIVRFLGRFHPVILHLPIGVFSLIILQEILSFFSREKAKPTLVPILFGAVSAVAAVIAGFLLYHGGGYEGSELAEDHLWGGLAFACAAIVTLIVKAWSLSPSSSPIFYRGLLFSSMGVMTYASHDGASLTHGSDYLTQYAPATVRKAMGLEVKEKKQEEKPRTLEDQVVYAEIIQPMLNKSCVECHKEGKAKGKLRMDTYEMLLVGGKEGPAIEPGSAEDSNIFYRIELEEEDEEHMPPEGKKDLEAHEVVILKWWLDQGADPQKKVGELELNDEIRAALSKVVTPGIVSAAPAEVKEAVASLLPTPELLALVAEIEKLFPAGLQFESQSSDLLTFTGVSMRENFSDDQFTKLHPVLNQLTSLDLSSTSITDKTVQSLANAKNLRNLRLSETEITDAALGGISKLTNLESLNLYGTKVTDKGVKTLSSLPKLKRLYVWQTPVTAEAIAELKKSSNQLEVVSGF